MNFLNFYMLLALMGDPQTPKCPAGNETIYHVNAFSGCQVYYVCQNEEYQTKVCPIGEAFNNATLQCEDASKVVCNGDMQQHLESIIDHKRQKRSVEEYHIIEIRDIKDKVVELYHKMKPVITESVQEIAPSVYSKFEAEYLPTIRSFKENVLPFFHAKLMPQVNKVISYTRNIAARVIEKVHRSYELSNSTHITVVSMSDIANDVSNDVIKPAMNVGRFLSGKGLARSRSKRNIFSVGISDMVSSFVTPVLNSLVDSFFKAQSNTITGRVIYPIVKELMKDPETRFDLFKLYAAAKSTFSPILWYMVRQQSYDTPEGIILNIPRNLIERAATRFQNNMKPIIFKVLDKHLQFILNHIGDESEFIIDTLKTLDGISGARIQLLNDAMLRFATKHGALLRSSRYTKHVSTYTLTEIMNDLRPIKVILFQIFADYVSHAPNSFFSTVFGPNSFLFKSFLGNNPQYARPIPFSERGYKY